MVIDEFYCSNCGTEFDSDLEFEQHQQKNSTKEMVDNILKKVMPLISQLISEGLQNKFNESQKEKGK